MNLREKTEGIVPEVPFNGILVSAKKIENKSNIIMSTDEATYEAMQEVIKAGPGATYGGNPQSPVEEGDIIIVNMINFAKRKTTNSLKDDIDYTKEYHEVSLPIVVFHNKEYMRITDRDILYYWKQPNEDCGIKEETVEHEPKVIVAKDVIITNETI